MHSLLSNRLRLIPLSQPELELLLISRNQLEKARGLTPSNLEVSFENFLDELAEGIRTFILPQMVAHPDEWLWYTHWLVVHRELNLTIGGIGATGPPHSGPAPAPFGLEAGQTLFGYFIDQKFEGQGYMTEAVACFLDGLFQDERLQAMIADTLVGPNASQRVLIKNGFTLVGPVEEGLRWKKTVYKVC